MDEKYLRYNDQVARESFQKTHEKTVPRPAIKKKKVRRWKEEWPVDGPAISKALQANAVEKSTAAMREHAEEPYKSKTLPTIGAKGYCPIIPLRAQYEGKERHQL